MLAEPMDTDHALWRIDLVDGLAEGRFALAIKVHHCMVDGLSIIDMLTTVLDAAPSGDLAAEAAWSPSAIPPRPALLGRGFTELFLPPLGALGHALIWPPRWWPACRAFASG